MINGEESIKDEEGKKKITGVIKLSIVGTFVEKIKFLDILPLKMKKNA